MKQYSLNGEPIEIESVSGQFLLIDPLYLQNIKADNQDWELKSRQDLIEIEKRCFPYGGTLLGYLDLEKDNRLKVDISNIKNWNTFNDPDELNRAEEKLDLVFATDSGIILVLDFVNVQQVLLTVGYDDLVDALDQLDFIF